MLEVLVSGVAINATSIHIENRIINQGNSTFNALVDNYGGGYNGLFYPNEEVEITYSGATLIKGTIDSILHVREQRSIWDLNDVMRLAGRDLSVDLNNKQYTRSFPPSMQIDNMIDEAIDETGCLVTILSATTPTISGHTSIDETLLGLSTRVMDGAGYEGYVTVSGLLELFPVGDAGRTTGITVDKTNTLGFDPTEAQGESIKNSITVLGSLKLFDPEIDDEWTEDSLDDWTLVVGDSLTLDVVDYEVGVKSVYAGGLISEDIELQFDFPETIRVGHYSQYSELGFWTLPVQGDFFSVRLYTDASNYFVTTIEHTAGSWQLHVLPLGFSHTHSDEFPDGIWDSIGEPDWLKITYVTWELTIALAELNIDGLYIGPKRVNGVSNDPTSQGLYGKRQRIIVNEAHTNGEAQNIADDMVARLKNPVKVIRVTMPLGALLSDGVLVALPGHRIEIDNDLLGGI